LAKQGHHLAMLHTPLTHTAAGMMPMLTGLPLSSPPYSSYLLLVLLATTTVAVHTDCCRCLLSSPFCSWSSSIVGICFSSPCASLVQLPLSQSSSSSSISLLHRPFLSPSPHTPLSSLCCAVLLAPLLPPIFFSDPPR
jgi:hypothetical protein